MTKATPQELEALAEYRRLQRDRVHISPDSLGKLLDLVEGLLAARDGEQEPVKAGEPVAWIAFASNGFIRFWTSDKERAEREKTNGLDLRGFTLAELVSLAAKSASDSALREALECCAAALQILPKDERDIIKFTGKWADYGSMTVANIIDQTNAALFQASPTKSDGGVEGHAISGIGPASEQSRQPETPIAGIEPGPSEATQPEPEAVLSAEILAELTRARTKFPGKNVTFAALVEEVGELATATFEEGRDRVRKEAVQVAVMAMRMVLDGDHTFDDWRASKGLDALAPSSPAST